MWIFESAIVNKLKLIHIDDWTFTSMDAKIGSPTFYTWGLKSINWSYNIHTCFPIIASNAISKIIRYNYIFYTKEIVALFNFLPIHWWITLWLSQFWNTTWPCRASDADRSGLITNSENNLHKVQQIFFREDQKVLTGLRNGFLWGIIFGRINK